MLDEDGVLEGRRKRSKTERRDLSIGIGKIDRRDNSKQEL